MPLVRSEEYRFDGSILDAYRALSGDVLLEPLSRGWRGDVIVGFNAIDEHRYTVGKGSGLSGLVEWMNQYPSVEQKTDLGFYGYIGYDVSKEIEEIPREAIRDIGLPDIYFRFYDTIAKIKDDIVEVELLSYDDQRATPKQRLDEVQTRLSHPMPWTPGDVEVSDVSSNFTKEEYLEAVEKVKSYIERGDTFQANISQRLEFTSTNTALEIYSGLRETNPSPYMGLIEFNGDAVISSSPELLVDADREALRTRPIAGTNPRSEDEKQNRLLREDLESSEKETAEHAILVDLARNDLGAVSEHGSVEVTSYKEPVEYSEVTHLESVVESKRRSNAGLVDVIESVFPGGTVTGAPKPRTMEIIEEVEPTSRGPYTGSMGVVSLDGRVTLNILIRTIVRNQDKHYLQVGGGVVHDSDAEDEYRETLHKAKGVLKAIQ